ncbi:MAG: hypothetical protein KDF24_12785 [Rhodocyclaceae bacterium]|mgnify:CR=1 FL=1|nr:hypothetical protein [Rhodocyclaceae bacterium]
MNALKWMLPLMAAAALSACSEQPQVVSYEAGHYSGKPDSRPWESAAYGGDKAAWQSDMRARARKQTEIGRMPE